MKKSLIPLLFLLPLSSCGESISFSYTDDYRLPYFDRDGDNLSLKGEEKVSECVRTVTSGDILVDKINQGEQLFFYFYGDSCSHCEAFFPKFRSFLKDASILCYAVETTNYFEVRNALINAFPNYVEAFVDAGTPSLYYFESRDEARRLDFYNYSYSVSSFEKYMHGQFNLTSIYHFASFSSYIRFVEGNECLTFVDDGSEESEKFYLDNLRPYARHQEKKIAYIELDQSEDDASFLSRLNSPLVQIKKGGSILKESSLENGKDLVLSYYGIEE